MRKFRDTKETDPRSDWILERIGKLYKLERAIALVESLAGFARNTHLVMPSGVRVEGLTVRELVTVRCWRLHFAVSSVTMQS